MVGLAVFADDTGAVGNQRHRQILNAHIVDYLIERSLEEHRVDRDEGFESLRRHSRRHADGVLLRDADVKDSIGEIAPRLYQPSALQHRRADADYGIVLVQVESQEVV